MFAIYHDFENDPDGMRNARDLLDSIKASAVVEQGTQFDPSASSGRVYPEVGELSSEVSEGCGTDSLTAKSRVTGDSGVPSSLSGYLQNGSGSSSSLDEMPGTGTDAYTERIEALDVPSKEAQLCDLFPDLKPERVAYTLQKCGGGFARAMDELLNQMYFESTGGEEKISAKGVDAFFVGDSVPRGRKGKGKRGKKSAGRTPELSRSRLSEDMPVFNSWKDKDRVVSLIASRTMISSAEVSSIWHRNGSSARGTLQAIIDLDMKKNEGTEVDDPVILDNAIELIGDFPTIEPSQAVALIRLTHPSTASAHELAKLFTSPASSQTPQRGGIQVIPRYAPISLSDGAPSTDSSSKSPLSPHMNALPQTSASLSAARHTAFTQASSAHRKGKSDPLMRAVAGYYGQVGRDYDAALKSASALEADALVRSQSTASQLDLHGVSVKDATRIARESVTMWWHELGEGRIQGRGVGGGYRIVTGVGNHSEGGRGKLGPAVGRVLLRDGWKVEFGTGYLVVKGVMQPK